MTVPEWAVNPTVRARRDGRNVVTILATKRYESEQWVLVADPKHPEHLYAFPFRTMGRRLQVDKYEFRVLVPPGILAHFRVEPVITGD
jgi:hypothetical protein